MKTSELRNIIKEEINKSLNEVENTNNLTFTRNELVDLLVMMGLQTIENIETGFQSNLKDVAEYIINNRP